MTNNEQEEEEKKLVPREDDKPRNTLGMSSLLGESTVQGKKRTSKLEDRHQFDLKDLCE